MAKRPTITTVASGYTSQATIDANFEAVRDQFDNTLSRDGSTPNEMGADLDLNSNDVLNAGTVNTDKLVVNGVDLTSPVWSTGVGDPEGLVTAPVGTLYTRSDGGSNTTLYVKESGSGNTGWVPK